MSGHICTIGGIGPRRIGQDRSSSKKGEAIDVEDLYVRKGREHLMKERSNGNG